MNVPDTPRGGGTSSDQDPGLRTRNHRDAELFREALRRYRRRETLQGVSLLGPHRMT